MAPSPSPGEITSLLAALKRGDPGAESNLVALVYDDLHALAQRFMRHERPDHTLQPTALVHEAYLRLLQKHAADWQSRAHFFAAASIAMRRILVDHARQRAAAKRPGGRQKVELNDFMATANPRFDQLLVLDEALTRLAEWDGRKARLVEMLYFGGLTEEEAASVLGVSVRTVKRDWKAARAWLQAQLDENSP
ncbi:MAG: sigma-70 family RNA polymerase sigma factor [Acidobacteriia bacterium]|nr:sigma-70 family RNA polymerase sigma factor [Terriglobia bacterium]